MSLDTLQSQSHSLTQNTAADGRGALCGGCKLSVESDTGGIVVAFGQALWHVDCFKCAKCGNRVNADTNLLLLSDGSPVCGSCSYNCSVCKLPILDEAIMTGDESYHAACFTCRSCSRKIEELVFAKTSQGIYCMTCHNERVARSRRHAEAKKKKQAKQKKEEEHKKEQTPSRSAVEPQTSPPQSASSPSFDPSIGTPRIQNANPVHQHPAKRISTTEIYHNGPFSTSSTLPPHQSSSSLVPSIREPAEPLSQSAPAPPVTDSGRTVPQRPRERVDTLSLPNGPGSGEIGRRRSFDDRPTSPYTNGASGPVSSLGVPTNKVERRRSMQTGLQMDAPPSKEWPQNSGSPVELGFSSSPHHESHELSLSSLRTKGTEESRQQLSPSGDGPAVRPRANSLSPGPSPHTSRSTTPVPNGVQPREQTSEEGCGHTLRLPPTEHYNSVSTLRVDTPQTPPIAPALPPITFSFGSTSFSDLISSVTNPKPAKKPATVLSEESSTISPISDSATTKFDSAPSSQNGHTPIDFVSRSSSLDTRGSPIPSLGEPYSGKIRERVDSNASTSSINNRPGLIRSDTAERVGWKLRETLNEAKTRAASTVELDREFVEAILTALQSGQARANELKTHLDHMKRASQRVYDGLAVAQNEYDQELAHRRDAEAEIGRLRLKVSVQSATIDAMAADHQKRKNLAKMENDMVENLQVLERELSKLRAEREMTLAEVEELNATKKAVAAPETTQLSRSLTNRFDNIRTKYRSELEPLFEQRETLLRELNELKTAKEKSLDEATRLTAQNESLQELNVKMQHQHDTLQSMMKPRPPEKRSKSSGTSGLSNPPSTSTLHSVTTSGTSNTLLESQEEIRFGKGARSDTELNPAAALRKFGWFKGGGGKDASAGSSRDATLKELPAPPVPKLLPRTASPPIVVEKPKTSTAPVHNFQQQGILRAARCDHCADKMWGSQLRCTICGIAVHTRCLNLTQLPCREASNRDEKEVILDINQPLPPSMFGRDLIEQVRADAKGGDRLIPVIVGKCIMAVEALAMDYEGIYRKTGGASQSKMITQLFERGDYDSFDLCDSDQFNDICSVTSVLKTYFRSLPNPLLTFDLHEQFVIAANYRDPIAKDHALANLVNELPPEHFETLRHLMLHLHRIMLQSDVNLMNARNLGVVFGPTLMRSIDSTKEFADMAGKALAIEWLIENAPTVFSGGKWAA